MFFTKSTPSSKPFVANDITLITTTILENKYVHFLTPKIKMKVVEHVLRELVTNVKLFFANIQVDKNSR
jgi:hypothetical protein